MKIIKATDPIPVEHPVFLIFGQPGIFKTSLGYSCKEPLTLDFDKGAHRAANRILEQRGHSAAAVVRQAIRDCRKALDTVEQGVEFLAS